MITASRFIASTRRFRGYKSLVRFAIGALSRPRNLFLLLFSMLAILFACLLHLRGSVLARQPRSDPSLLPPGFVVDVDETNATHSQNVSSCPGYTLSSVKETNTGLAAHLSLAGTACNAFGQDITDLTVQVTYESDSRLHVNIFDTAQSQFTIPSSVISLPPQTTASHKQSSDLVFNYDPSPFAFWITRRAEPDAQPLFDTRTTSLPPTPIPPVISGDSSTALDGFPLVFEDQYLQLTSALPLGTNIYGLGEVVASSGFRRDVGTNGGIGTIQTMWARDIQDPLDENVYGSHPIYLEHRYNETTKRSQSHGVFLFSSAGSDILLLTPPSSPVSLVQYRLISGTLDFYFFSGPSPQKVVEQYGALIGMPTWQPAWGFGFHLCRWGYHDVNETKEQVMKMREADIPLEVMWNDIDLYHAVRDFTSDPVTFPGEEMRSFIQELVGCDYLLPGRGGSDAIVDAAIAHQVNATDIYDPYIRGVELDTFIKNPDGSEYIGQVWPGYTNFPDWFADNALEYWTEGLRNWSQGGIEFSGIWLDMNEASSFCTGSCGTGANLSNTSTPFLLPGDPGNPITDYPEGYNATIWGPSGNITINGMLTFGNDSLKPKYALFERDDVEARDAPDVNLNTPPYAIHNGAGPLSVNTIATNATHAGGYKELDVHNMWGLMEEKTTHLALQALQPRQRPFMISRSTFPSSGRWTGHWLGDNWSKWQYMYLSIQGVLQFQLFQVPFVGADTCGFQDNTDEELCNRWMQLSAFVPFYRNHNQRGALSQEPYRWDSVAAASRTAIGVRYSLLPYWYTLFANASTHGTPPVRALFFEFPDEPELFAVDRQFLIGRDILVTPVLTPNVSTVDGIFPGRGKTIWRDWYTHDVVDAVVGANTTLAAPLGHINVHVRDGAAILLHAEPAYTVTETRAGPYALLVAQAADGHAFGTAYIDDGETLPPTPNATLTFTATRGQIAITSRGAYDVKQKLNAVTVLGVSSKPVEVWAVGKKVDSWDYVAEQEKLAVNGLGLDLNVAATISWK
ncbi:Alpha-glucosidase [Grifola frondosa]|uniref:Alpha-glucosidase n=1 Tax=Grifola frondosa TaxID=5627 RepID=A0A1C7M5I3_GRIFR|nr:Alpha-glucosidase [Grifola frondosa]